MVQVLSAKDNAKAAWDTIKTMRVSMDRVCEARRQRLCKDFDNLTIKSGEVVEDFSLHMSSIMSELQSLGDPVGSAGFVDRGAQWASCRVGREWRARARNRWAAGARRRGVARMPEKL
jgi:hypothetical protein